MKIFSMIIKWVMYILVSLLSIALISLFLYKSYLKKSTEIKTSNGVSSLEQITLGGLKQWIFIRGEEIKNPVLIFLHGGPGAPLMGMSSSRKFDAKLIKHFTVVHWDQRGAGKSYNDKIPVDSMTFDRLVEDCYELIEYMCIKFEIQKVFIVGHSGGSVVGIKTTHKYPEKIYAYVGVGQIINHLEQQKLSYNYIVEKAEASGDVKQQKIIKAIGPPPYKSHKRSNKKDAYIFQFGGIILKNKSKQMARHVLGFFTSPEYSLSDGIATAMNRGFKFTSVAMWDEIRNINIEKEIQSIKVPVYFIEGKYDMATPTVLVERFYNILNAEKGKQLIIFENSAHLPMIEEKEKYEQFLTNIVLKESQNN